MAGRRHYDGDLAVLALLDDRPRPLRRGKVDRHIRMNVEGKGIGDGHADRTDPGQLAGVPPLVRVSGGIDCRDNLKITVLVRERDDSLAHAPARPVDRDPRLHRTPRVTRTPRWP